MDIAKIRKKIKGTGGADNKDKERSRFLKEPEGGSTPSNEANSGRSLRGEAAAIPSQASSKTADSPREPEPAVQEERRVKGERREPPETQVKAGPDRAAEVVEILTFRLLKEEFAFSISHLEEILRYQRITAVPNVPKYILGITSLRGKVIPVIDLKLKLSLTGRASDDTGKGKILIVRGPKGPIGVAVDKVIGVVRIPRSDILPPPSHLSEGEVKFIDGIAVVDKRFVSIINMPATLALSLK